MMLAIRFLTPCARNLSNHGSVALAARRAPPPSLLQCMRLQHRTSTLEDSGKGSENTGSQQRIYHGSLAPRMRAVKVLSLTTSVVGLFAQPTLLAQGMKMGGTWMAVFICSFAGFFTFITPLLLHFVTKKYVTEIHYNSETDEYTATTISLLLWKIKTKFRPSDVRVPEVPGMFTSFFIGKRPLFVDPTMFEDTEHYVRIMGYDKPIDFKLNIQEVPAEVKDEAVLSANDGKIQK